MGWKSTITISRNRLENKIMGELNSNIENLTDETLTQIIELLGDDENSCVYGGYNYSVGEDSDY